MKTKPNNKNEEVIIISILDFLQMKAAKTCKNPSSNK